VAITPDGLAGIVGAIVGSVVGAILGYFVAGWAKSRDDAVQARALLFVVRHDIERGTTLLKQYAGDSITPPRLRLPVATWDAALPFVAYRALLRKEIEVLAEFFYLAAELNDTLDQFDDPELWGSLSAFRSMLRDKAPDAFKVKDGVDPLADRALQAVNLALRRLRVKPITDS
jgi:hypothetical protein